MLCASSFVPLVLRRALCRLQTRGYRFICFRLCFGMLFPLPKPTSPHPPAIPLSLHLHDAPCRPPPPPPPRVQQSPKFLLSVVRAAVAATVTSSYPSPGLSVDVVSALARDAGLSASLQAAVVRATAAPTALSVRARRADLVRKAVGLHEGEACALVNGRR